MHKVVYARLSGAYGRALRTGGGDEEGEMDSACGRGVAGRGDVSCGAGPGPGADQFSRGDGRGHARTEGGRLPGSAGGRRCGDEDSRGGDPRREAGTGAGAGGRDTWDGIRVDRRARTCDYGG